MRVVSTGADNAHLVWQSPDPSSGYVDKYKCRYNPVGTQQYQVIIYFQPLFLGAKICVIGATIPSG